MEIPTPDINKAINPTNEINKDVFSIKLLKLFVLFSIPLIEILVPFINSFKYGKSILLSDGINLILYFTNEPGMTNPDWLSVFVVISNLYTYFVIK